MSLSFFFQAEDGIRDYKVTGVQTCALPIFATVDAYAGDVAARELTRAVKELGLRGVFVESAKGDLLPNAPEARPTFATAAALGVPVFVHPVTDPAMHNRFKRLGPLGVRLARPNINAARLVALPQGGVF